MLDEELEVMVLMMLSELGRRMDEYTEKFNKEIENIRKCQTELIVLKTTMTKLKNTVEGINNRLDEVGVQISKLEDKAVELTQTEQLNKKEI